MFSSPRRYKILSILSRAKLDQREQGLTRGFVNHSIPIVLPWLIPASGGLLPELCPLSRSLPVVLLRHGTRLPGLVFCDLAACFLTLVQATGGYCNLSLSSSPWPSPCLLSTYRPVTSLVLFVDRVPIVVDPKQVQMLCSNGHAPHVFHFRQRRLCHNRRALNALGAISLCRISRKPMIHQVLDCNEF